jgi:NDP-mannose synthase
MRAVILAGGRGTRLAPYTTIFPKPLMPIGDVPIVEIVIRQLRHFGFRRVTLAVGHLSELIRAYLGNRREYLQGIEIDFSYESSPTGTAGAVARIPDLDGTFLAMNGDVLTDVDYRELVERHRGSGAALTIATSRKRVKVDLGVIETSKAGYVSGYREKPELLYEVSMGIYVYEPRVLSFVPCDGYLDFPDLVEKLLANGERVGTYHWSGYWLDIGRPEDYQAAVEQFSQKSAEFHID